MSSPLARRYARALFMLGEEQGNVALFSRELDHVAEAVRGSAELLRLLADPVVSPVDRKSVMTEVLSRLGVSPTVRNAVLLLTDRRKGAHLPEVAEALRALGDEKAGKVQAVVTSAVPLGEGQYQRLATVLEKLTGKKVTLERKLDPALIGGVVTRIGDKVYDGSVRTRLEELRHAAMQG